MGGLRAIKEENKMSNLFIKNQHLHLDEIPLEDGKDHGWFSGHKWRILHDSEIRLTEMGYQFIEIFDDLYSIYSYIHVCNCGAKKIVRRVMPG